MEKVAAFERGKTNHALFPIEIFQAQGGDLAGAYTQAGGHQQDSEVPFSTRCLAVDVIQHPEHLRREQSPRSASKPVVRGRAQRCGPIAIEMTQAEKVTEQATQYFMNTVNAPDAVGSLLADELVEVMHLELVPVADLVGAEELIEAAHKQLNLYERVLGQIFVFFQEAQVVGDLREMIGTSHGNSEREGIAFQPAGGVCPAEEGAQTILQGDVVVRLKKAGPTLETGTGSSPRFMADPVSHERRGMVRSECFQGVHLLADDKALQAP